MTLDGKNDMTDAEKKILAAIKKDIHIKEIKNAPIEWEQQQLIEEERFHSFEKRYRELIYFYNEKYKS